MLGGPQWAPMGQVEMKRGRRRAEKKLPAWLLGLIFGAVLFAIVLFFLEVIGYGDDPAIGLILI